MRYASPGCAIWRFGLIGKIFEKVHHHTIRDNLSSSVPKEKAERRNLQKRSGRQKKYKSERTTQPPEVHVLPALRWKRVGGQQKWKVNDHWLKA